MADLEAQANAEGRGLWAEAEPVPPWDWRRRSASRAEWAPPADAHWVQWPAVEKPFRAARKPRSCGRAAWGLILAPRSIWKDLAHVAALALVALPLLVYLGALLLALIG